jgi:uncharacterized membrane protein (UPF0127 family)
MNQNLKDIIKHSEKCSSLLSKIRGFMFSFSKKPKIFIFNKEQQVKIHTFFCFFPLKIIYFNKNWKIARQEIAKPFRILRSCKAKYILEIPHWK